MMNDEYEQKSQQLAAELENARVSLDVLPVIDKLIELGDPRAVEMFINIFKTGMSKAGICQEIPDALEQFGDIGIDAIKQALTSDDVNVRYWAIYACDYIEDERFLPFLEFIQENDSAIFSRDKHLITTLKDFAAETIRHIKAERRKKLIEHIAFENAKNRTKNTY